MQSETLVEEFSRLVREYKQDDGPGGIEAWNLIADFAVDNADAIEAALSATEPQPAPSVAVKALEWSDEDNGDFIAQSIVGWHHIGLPHLTWNLMTPNGDVPSFNTLKEAKAAAQADYEARVSSALSAQVQDVAVEDVLSERKRQVEREGWTPEHDDAYTEYELAWAAITYAMAACADSAERAVMDQFGDHSATPGRINENWPWDWKWWKPKDRRRDLVRAAALIIAEIERLDRAAAPAKQEGGTNE